MLGGDLGVKRYGNVPDQAITATDGDTTYIRLYSNNGAAWEAAGGNKVMIDLTQPCVVEAIMIRVRRGSPTAPRLIINKHNTDDGTLLLSDSSSVLSPKNTDYNTPVALEEITLWTRDSQCLH